MFRYFFIIGGLIWSGYNVYADNIDDEDEVLLDPIFTEICWGRELYCSTRSFNFINDCCDTTYRIPSVYSGSITDTLVGWIKVVVYVDTSGIKMHKELPLTDICIQIDRLYGSEQDIKSIDSAEVSSFYKREFSSMHYWVCKYSSQKYTLGNYIWKYPFKVIPLHRMEI